MPGKIAVSSYRKLVADITSLYSGARTALVEAYWKIGQRIVEVEQKGEIKAAYGTGLLQKLSEDLAKQCGPGFSLANLKRMRSFYQIYPKSSAPSQLSWTQYVELLPVGDVAVRRHLEKLALEEGLPHKAIRELVRHERVRKEVEENLAVSPETREPPDLLKVPKPGLLNVYQIKDSNDTAWPDKNVLLFDHGFKAYRALTPQEGRGLKAGDVVEWVGTKLRKWLAPRSTNHVPQRSNVARGSGDVAQLYTYRAYLESVIDGDTLWVVLDIGMSEVSRQKLRLRGIDCPEINTREGLAAKKFMESVLQNVPYLIVLSSKNASYDRYEADVFFTDKDGQEVYLNNLLLEKGYAVRVRE